MFFVSTQFEFEIGSWIFNNEKKTIQFSVLSSLLIHYVYTNIDMFFLVKYKSNKQIICKTQTAGHWLAGGPNSWRWIGPHKDSWRWIGLHKNSWISMRVWVSQKLCHPIPSPSKKKLIVAQSSLSLIPSGPVSPTPLYFCYLIIDQMDSYLIYQFPAPWIDALIIRTWYT